MSPRVADRIVLRGLLVHAVVGVHPWERKGPRELRLDLVLETDLRRAGRSDDLEDTVDYDALSRFVRTRIETLAPKLIETVAETAAEACLQDARVSAVEVTVHKPGAVADAQDVAVIVRRTR